MEVSFNDITDAMIADELTTCKALRVIWTRPPDDPEQKAASVAERLAGLSVADVRQQLGQVGRANNVELIRRAIAKAIVQGGFADAAMIAEWG